MNAKDELYGLLNQGLENVKKGDLIPAQEALEDIEKSLFGIIPKDASLEEIKKERLSKKH